MIPLGHNETRLKEMIRAINQLIRGLSNAKGSVTLRANETTPPAPPAHTAPAPVPAPTPGPAPPPVGARPTWRRPGPGRCGHERLSSSNPGSGSSRSSTTRS